MLISPLAPILIGVGMMTGCLLGAFSVLRKKRIIDDLPTSKTQGVFIGLAELKGTAESDHPFTSYLSESKCVYYSWQVEEEWRRTVTETFTDSKGHLQTRTRVESGWKKVASGSEFARFYLKDDSGLIQISPDGANIQDESLFNRTVDRSESLYYLKGPSPDIASSTHRRRFIERGIPLHRQLYILGQARQRQDVVAAEIAQDKQSPLFIISTRTEKQISRGYTGWFWMWTVLGLIISLATAFGWLSVVDNETKLTWQPWIIMGLGYCFVLTLGYIWTTYDNLISLHHRVEQGWSQVEVQLKRRFDLIPNLVQAVESFLQYEKETQSTLALIRSQMQAIPNETDVPNFQGLSTSLRILSEKYPQLKADENFLKLQLSLTDSEQRIALARDYFNQVTTFYNTRLETIPERFVALLARLKPRRLMLAENFERAPVEIRLAE